MRFPFLKSLRKYQKYRNVEELSTAGRHDIILGLIFRTLNLKKRNFSVELKKGALFFDPTHKPDWRVFNSVFVSREYANLNPANSVILDIGGHRGFFAAYCLYHGASKVLAYEPVPENFAYLKSVVDGFACDTDRAKAWQKAVGAQEGNASFYVYKESWSHSLVKRKGKKISREIQVDVVSFSSILQDILQQNQFREKLIVKIDVEGSELEIIQSLDNDLLSQIDELFVEVHSFNIPGVNGLLTKLKKAGFRSWAENDQTVGDHRIIQMRNDFS